jgi:hypothetical protein
MGHDFGLTRYFLGRIYELHIVLVDMLLERGRNMVTVALNLGFCLLKFGSAHTFVDQPFNVWKFEDFTFKYCI